MLDADFIPGDGNDLHLTRANWDGLIDYFDGEKMCGKTKPENEYLQWAPVFPAYYEENRQEQACYEWTVLLCGDVEQSG